MAAERGVAVVAPASRRLVRGRGRANGEHIGQIRSVEPLPSLGNPVSLIIRPAAAAQSLFGVDVALKL
ncbi:hypothetical protein JOF56_008839 [Kibdelosporangium banguiense]|uniref:Uncharacterized protein n=1 Tax=Kibdelosporangium banguiense TaxID=1365924 RepID=A0ABS4TVM1_9PSEU|nr:hypothetical protein [Kibdelosporangium banguiense]